MKKAEEIVTYNILDPRNFKPYTIKNLKVAHHNIPDKHGKAKVVKCVEYIVIGANHEWKNWMLYEDFKIANKKIEI